MQTVFSLPDYSVCCGNLREYFPGWLRERRYSKILILADSNTRRLCLPVLHAQTGLPADTPVVEIPAGEAFKTLATCEGVWQQLLEHRLDRQALIINLGGGVVGDLGGFCAATFKRGVDFIQVPTTLLSMTDAAIGGKLGIDFQGIKNAVGVFHYPAAVFVDPAFLSTLPERELRSGFAEVIKHALIGDPQLWQKIGRLNALSPAACAELLPASIAVKVRIVSEDPLEKGLRALLNFGHTIGHALESYWLDSPDPLTHGEAVAMGMILETRHAWGDQPLTHEIETVIRRFFPARPIPDGAQADLWQLMQHDKKNAAGVVRMALPVPGQPFQLDICEVRHWP